MFKKIWQRLFESKEEKEKRLIEEHTRRMEKKSKEDHEIMVEQAKEKLRNIMNRKKVLNVKTSFTTFGEFYRMYGSRWEEIVKKNSIPQDELDMVLGRVQYLMDNDENFRDAYGKWAHREADKDISNEAKKQKRRPTIQTRAKRVIKNRVYVNEEKGI